MHALEKIEFLREQREAISRNDTSEGFRFFPIRDIPLRFIYKNIIFSAPLVLIHPIFA